MADRRYIIELILDAQNKTGNAIRQAIGDQEALQRSVERRQQAEIDG